MSWKFYDANGNVKTVGETGPAGVGVPAGGTTGQRLAKASATDFDTEWVTAGGATITVEEDGDTPITDVDHVVFAATGDATVSVVDDTGGQVTVTVGASGGGGGGGWTPPTVIQTAEGTTSGSPSATLAAAPTDGNLLVLIGAQNGGAYSSVTQTNVTWTQRRADNVGGVGNLIIWTGAVGASAGTTVTTAGGGGGGSIFVIELSGYSYSSLGAGGLYGLGFLANLRSTAKLTPVPSGRLVCFICHTAGGTPTSRPEMSVPSTWSTVTGVNGLAFGFSTGAPVLGYHANANAYTLVDIVP